MLIKTILLACAASLTLAPSTPVDGEGEPAFEELAIILERNETDGDAEIVTTAETTHGLRWLKVRGPGDRRALLSVRTRDDVGQREFLLESAEPSLEEVLAAFPEGVYEFEGRTIDGTLIRGEAELSHDILPAPSLFASVGADVVVSWSPVDGAEGYLVEIEHDELDVNITARVPADATSFTVPGSFLQPGTEYEVGVATLSPNGNVAFAESTFQTLP